MKEMCKFCNSFVLMGCGGLNDTTEYTNCIYFEKVSNDVKGICKVCRSYIEKGCNGFDVLSVYTGCVFYDRAI